MCVIRFDIPLSEVSASLHTFSPLNCLMYSDILSTSLSVIPANPIILRMFIGPSWASNPSATYGPKLSVESIRWPAASKSGTSSMIFLEYTAIDILSNLPIDC